MATAWQKLRKFKQLNSTNEELALRQRHWLMECLRRNESSRYGIEQRFSDISSVEQFQAEVPMISYQDIMPYISEMEAGASDCLFCGHTVAFERTSGTLGGQKLIPYSTESLRDFRRAVLPWLINLISYYQIETGSAYWAISPATRLPQTTSGDLPVGLPEAAYLGEDMAPFFETVTAVPGWVSVIAEIGDWQLATLYYLVCRKDLRLISVWSPTFLIVLLDALAERQEELESVLLRSTRIKEIKLDVNREAHARLCKYCDCGNPAILWPELEVISCWADASSKPFADVIRQRFSDTPLQPKGLLATEGVVTVPNQNGQPLLSANSGFYEFIDDQQTVHLAQQLEAGRTYEVIMTSSGGLYRYRTHDQVICEGYLSGLPVLRFHGRDSSSDLVGEKLTENFVMICLEDISGFRMLIPNSDGSAGYTLLLDNCVDADTLAMRIESRLIKNPQYAYARKLGQLKPLRTISLNKPLQIYLNSAAHAGVCLGDIKVPSLCLKPSVFDSYLGTDL